MGHFCWCCERERRNEKFTGRGHRDHICKDCQKLPKKEREIRQAIRNINQLCTWEGFIRKKRRKEFDKYLDHPEEQVREYAQQVLEHDREERKLQRKHQQQDEDEIDKRADGFAPDPADDEPASSWSPPDDDIPF
jgi:hypothetical protein